MVEAKIVGYKKIFGLILPDWISEKMLRVFVVGVLSVLAMLLIAVFYVKPMFDDIVKLEASLKTESKALAVLEESKSGIDKLNVELNNSEKAKILASIPNSYSPDRAIFILREIANLTGVSIISYSLPSGVLLDTNQVESTTKRTNDLVNFTSYPIKIVVAAPVDVLLKFINKVETSLPYGIVSDLNLQEVTKLAKQAQSKNVQIAMELRYYQVSLGRINLNKIETLTEKNLETADLLQGFDLITVDEKSIEATGTALISTSSADMFGF
ncbi:hypothetical protein A2572_00545 [Candidatus Collierbacteria bacterium RIFOXYD1_FULL_40_9]|uniref:Uncharacterized protein n=1 Tax=Candidatus Collierbacteria bacterium RIFOXYD1_FULL_40_9 TaxID=1817731 RepID=A0A1F5FWL1_9BACT|nr:MAG: hypothetical protein A2572_00545 [Candidatus Collierbacteria bacterium RIFOXYD1_FULL_40_9]